MSVSVHRYSVTPLCAACKNKQSTDRCTNSALTGLLFCGVHAKMKQRRLWTTVHGLDDKIIKTQKLWKGYIVRKRLALAGPGVLKRKVCNNQDELISLEPIDKVFPFDYFGFEENGKVYGFDFRTALDALHRGGANPFTRQPFTLECRKRLRDIYGYRMRHKLENYYENNIFRTPESLVRNRWTQVCQIIEENGFYTNLHVNTFLGLNRTQLFVFLRMICNDIQIWAQEHKKPGSRRIKYFVWVKEALRKMNMNMNMDMRQFSFIVSSVLCIMLYDCAEPYNICFIIMSSLYKL